VLEPRERPESAFRRRFGEYLAILRADQTTWYAGVTAAVVLTFSRYHLSTGEYNRLVSPQTKEHGGPLAVLATDLHLPRFAQWLKHAIGNTSDYLYWFFGSLLLYFVIPLFVAWLLPKVRVRELGIGFGEWRAGLKATALLYGVMLPFVIGASFTKAFSAQYPMSGAAAESWTSLLIYQVGYCAYFIGWEFLYRGVLCNALYPRIGMAALLLQTIPFAIMHAGKPELEAYGSIVAGIALGALAVRTRSFWYGALLHSMVAVTMDALALTQTHRWPRVW
jgi:membrane protease YdiL (CAAX protease family)